MNYIELNNKLKEIADQYEKSYLKVKFNKRVNIWEINYYTDLILHLGTIDSCGVGFNKINLLPEELSLINKFVDTPQSNRFPVKKYNLILFKDFYAEREDYLNLTAIKKGMDHVLDLVSIDNIKTEDLKEPDLQFTEKEIVNLIEKRPEFENIIRSAMVEAPQCDE